MAKLTEATCFNRKQDSLKNRKWFVVDVKDKILGRIASRIAYILRGKHKPDYNPYSDHGDNVVVLNVDKLRLTGRKLEQKESYYFTGYPTGHKRTQYKKLMAEKPEEALFLAVKGMLPKNSMGRHMIKKMKMYRGENHPHSAQKVEAFPSSYLLK